VLADGTDGSSRVMGRGSGPSTRRPEAAVPMRLLPGAAGPVAGCQGLLCVTRLATPDRTIRERPLPGAAGARVGASTCRFSGGALSARPLQRLIRRGVRQENQYRP